jgi:hypothetical protein
MTKNKCAKCGGNIKENYNPSPTDKPSARVTCDKCLGIRKYANIIQKGGVNMETTQLSTKDLTEELEKREGITKITLDPYEDCRIITGHGEHLIQGPAIILVNQD